MKFVYALARYLTSGFLLLYGFAKVNGSQFTILASELDRPMGQVSGFWLTWYYFGYSPIYGNFIALAQILAGILLMFRKTTLLGSCIAFPVVTNIIMVDVFYAIDIGALLVALLMEFSLITIFVMHRKELVDLFWTRQNSLFPSSTTSRTVTAGKHAVRILLVVIMATFTYWVANYNNRFPTALDGTWDVVQVSGANHETNDPPTVVFLERNRAHLCVFKRKDGSYEWHHFELNPEARTITIWKEWLQKGDKIYEGQYDSGGTRVELKGKLANTNEELAITLRRRS
jgi:hypothetical protein